MSIKLTILGCHSATPRANAHPSSQYLEINNRRFLIDCGEGTQVRLRENKIKFSKISHVFISHLHGDHFYGLIGLISTFGLLNRQNDLHIFGPEGIKKIITLQLRLSQSWIHFEIIFHELTSAKSELIFEDDKVTVHTIPLSHRVYTNGFLFKEKLGERNLIISEINKHHEIEVCDYQNLKNGKDFVNKDGTIIKNKSLTKDPKNTVSYAYCSDTQFKPEITTIIQHVDLLYHEATFLEDKVALCIKTKHSTAKQAAAIAKQANAKQLILGHFSNRYKNIELFKEEAQTTFHNVSLAKEGKIYEIKNK